VVIAPVCSVANYGSLTESYVVRVKIGTGYNQTFVVTNHAPGTRIGVAFPEWTANEVGTFAVSCSTELAGDGKPANDCVRDSVIVIPPTGVSADERLPKVFSLSQPSPSAFVSRTTIAYALPRAVMVELKVYSPTGRLVRRLSAGQQAAGWYRLVWDGRDEQGRPVSAGAYFCRLEAGGFRAAVALLKL
jgi:hypothetical protein